MERKTRTNGESNTILIAAHNIIIVLVFLFSREKIRLEKKGNKGGWWW